MTSPQTPSHCNASHLAETLEAILERFQPATTAHDNLRAACIEWIDRLDTGQDPPIAGLLIPLRFLLGIDPSQTRHQDPEPCAFPHCTTTPNPMLWPEEPPHCVDHCTVHATLTADTETVYIPLADPFTQETNPT